MESPNATTVLLGAGASKPAGLPLSSELTNLLTDRFPSRRLTGAIIRFVAGCLLMGKGERGEDLSGGINVERLFNAIDFLDKRRESEIYPLVNQWHPKIDSLESRALDVPSGRRDVADDTVEQILWALGNAMQDNAGFDTDIDQAANALRSAIAKYSRLEASTAFAFAKRKIITETTKILWKDSSELETSYLNPLVEWAYSSGGTILSMNYDNCIEVACKHNNRPMRTGINEWIQGGSFSKRGDTVELLKLHGSMNWSYARHDDSSRRGIRNSVAELDDPNEKGTTNINPAIVFGAGNKLTAEGPFLEIFRAFQERLSNNDHLIAIGYSFSDDHVNEVVFDWLDKKEKTHLTIIDGKDGVTGRHPVQEEFGSLFLQDRVTFEFCGAVNGIKKCFS